MGAEEQVKGRFHLIYKVMDTSLYMHTGVWLIIGSLQNFRLMLAMLRTRHRNAAPSANDKSSASCTRSYLSFENS